MPRGKAGPWYWSARGGWYATVGGKRYRLLDGPDDPEHAAKAGRKYQAVKTPTPPLVRLAAAREEGVAIGRMMELVHLIDWYGLLRDHDHGGAKAGAGESIDPDVLTAVGINRVRELLGKVTTAADAEAVLLDAGVIPSGTAPAGRRAIPGLRRLLGLYPL